eukprot:gene26956-32570_t
MSSKSKQTPYEILGVSRTASAKEIKMAFYREAKKHHPDMHPNDPTAKARFQEIANAYELLSDESKRRAYDFTGQGWGDNGMGGSTSQGSNANDAYANKHAEDVFNQVSSDLDIIKEALKLYQEEVQDELGVAFLMYTGNLQLAARMLWKMIVDLSLEQKKRKEARRRS